MPTFVQTSDRLVVRFEPGQFTFRHYRPIASDQQVYDLARQLNTFQEDEPKQILRVVTRQLM